MFSIWRKWQWVSQEPFVKAIYTSGHPFWLICNKNDTRSVDRKSQDSGRLADSTKTMAQFLNRKFVDKQSPGKCKLHTFWPTPAKCIFQLFTESRNYSVFGIRCCSISFNFTQYCTIKCSKSNAGTSFHRGCKLNKIYISLVDSRETHYSIFPSQFFF